MDFKDHSNKINEWGKNDLFRHRRTGKNIGYNTEKSFEWEKVKSKVLLGLVSKYHDKSQALLIVDDRKHIAVWFYYFAFFTKTVMIKYTFKSKGRKGLIFF